MCHAQVFHRMDSMLKDAAYGAELEALRRNNTDGHGAQPDTPAGAGTNGTPNDTDASEEDSQVSTSEALDMLRQVRPTRSLLLSFCMRVLCMLVCYDGPRCVGRSLK